MVTEQKLCQTISMFTQFTSGVDRLNPLRCLLLLKYIGLAITFVYYIRANLYE